MTIYKKILAIMSEVRYLNKDDNVSFGTTKYKALSEEKVTEIMRDKLVKYKLVVYPVQQTSTRNGHITHVDVEYEMVNAENPDERIRIASCGDGADSQDKGSGKAMTVGAAGAVGLPEKLPEQAYVAGINQLHQLCAVL